MPSFHFNFACLAGNPAPIHSLPPVNVAAAEYCPPQHSSFQSHTGEMNAVRVEKTTSKALALSTKQETLSARFGSRREAEILKLAEGYPLSRATKRSRLDLRMQPASFWVPMTPPRCKYPTSLRPTMPKARSSRRVKSVRSDPLAQPFFGKIKPIADKDLEAEKKQEDFRSTRLFKVIDDLCDAWEEKEQEKIEKKVEMVVEGVKFAAEVAVNVAKVAWPFIGYLVMETLQR
ncbi:hypothetical protein TWF694_005611 [Orbilia ellipsospora]|uniref:Uncharacterized protein n=1 Tax=Orbilia ellipsospora TaxID=2528407 RepID=A0AAV9WW33_9PEZI